MTTINQSERQFLYSKLTNVSSQDSLMAMRKRYYTEYIGGASQYEGLESLERLYLSKIISDNGGQPSQYPKFSEAVSQLGLTPESTENQNKILLYQALT